MYKGFTLIEVLITTTLFAVLVLAVVQLYVVYGRVIDLQKSSISVALDGSSIMHVAREAGLQATNVVASRTFEGITYESGTTTIIFEIPSIDASGSILSGAYDYVGMYASGTAAYRVIDSAPGSVRTRGTKTLTNALNALSFTYDNASFPSVASFTVDATTTATVRGVLTQMHLREHIYLRNL